MPQLRVCIPLLKILHAAANIWHSQININIQTKTQLHDGGIWERYREQNNWPKTGVLLREIHWRSWLMVVEMSKSNIYWEAGRLGWKLKQQLRCNLESKIHRAGWKDRNPGKICVLGSWGKFLLLPATSMFASTDWMRPTHIIKGNLPFKSTDCKC